MGAVVGLSIGAFAIIGALVTLSILQSKWLKNERDDAKENWKSHDAVVKSNFDLQLQVRVLTQDVKEKDNALVFQGQQIEREVEARQFMEEKLRKFVLNLGEKGDPNVLAKNLEDDLQRLNQIRQPGRLPPVPTGPAKPSTPVHRPTPAETPLAKATVPIDAAMLETLKGKTS